MRLGVKLSLAPTFLLLKRAPPLTVAPEFAVSISAHFPRNFSVCEIKHKIPAERWNEKAESGRRRGWGKGGLRTETDGR